MNPTRIPTVSRVRVKPPIQLLTTHVNLIPYPEASPLDVTSLYRCSIFPFLELNVPMVESMSKENLALEPVTTEMNLIQESAAPTLILDCFSSLLLQ